MNPYNDYNSYLKSKYGCKVYKIALDAGLSCPNRDGTKGYNGCIYCNDDGSRAGYTDHHSDIRTQLASRIEYLKNFKNASKFIAYFQAFTNTYAPVDKLKKIYDQILGFDGIVGLSIGTRPDTVDEAKSSLISSYMDRYDVCLEMGLQSIHNETLKSINRGHTFENFLEAFAHTRKFKIPVCAHIILGLPGETREDMLETARTLTGLRVAAVKIHLLHILKGSALEMLFREGKVRVMEQAQYVELVCDFLEELSPEIIVQRLTGQGSGPNHIAPGWARDKTETIDKICEMLKKRGTFQGFNCRRPAIS